MLRRRKSEKHKTTMTDRFGNSRNHETSAADSTSKSSFPETTSFSPFSNLSTDLTSANTFPLLRLPPPPKTRTKQQFCSR
ncbi:hypothetical protein PS1_005972 [Malus domestica]